MSEQRSEFTSRFELVDHCDFAVIECDGVEVLRMPRSDFFNLVVVRHAAEVLPEHWALVEHFVREGEWPPDAALAWTSSASPRR